MSFAQNWRIKFQEFLNFLLGIFLTQFGEKMFPRRRCADSRLDHVAGEEVVMRPQGGFVSQLDAPDPRRLMPYGAVKRHKYGLSTVKVMINITFFLPYRILGYPNVLQILMEQTKDGEFIELQYASIMV